MYSANVSQFEPELLCFQPRASENVRVCGPSDDACIPQTLPIADGPSSGMGCLALVGLDVQAQICHH